MITVQDFARGRAKRRFKVLVVGHTGSGKTHFGATFSKPYILFTEPGSEEVILNNKELRKNVVGWDYFIPTSKQDTKRVFEDLIKAIDTARERAEKGEIDTLILDNLTFLALNRMDYIETFEPTYSRSGEQDTRAMFGALNRWLYNFTLMKILTFPGHVVCTCHIKMEDEESMAKKPDTTTPLMPAILGGFRDTVAGLFSAVFYLDCIKEKDGKYHYFARTQKGNKKLAKNRFNLPEILENISYQTLVEAAKKAEV